MPKTISSGIAAIVASIATTWAGPQALAIEAWRVRPFYADDAPPSVTQMVLESLPQEPARPGAIDGSFYGSTFVKARATRTDHALILSAVIEDASGAYHHAGRFSGDVFVDRTLAVGCDFLMSRTATKGDGSCS